MHFIGVLPGYTLFHWRTFRLWWKGLIFWFSLKSMSLSFTNLVIGWMCVIKVRSWYCVYFSEESSPVIAILNWEKYWSYVNVVCFPDFHTILNSRYFPTKNRLIVYDNQFYSSKWVSICQEYCTAHSIFHW